MTGIHDVVMEYVRDALEKALISDVLDDDPARAGVVKIGHLQGEPAPDDARISITIHENDPDKFTKGALTSIDGPWDDGVVEVEVGGTVTSERKFTIKARCLFANTREDLDAARNIASTLRDRIEKCLLKLRFSSVATTDEFVSRGIIATSFVGEMLQAGGPPDAFDYHLKIRFDIWTTRNGAQL